MATDTVTIEQFAEDNGITLTSVRASRNPNMEGSADMDNWKVTLERPSEAGRKLKMTLYFSKGIGHHGVEPTVEEVLDCLASETAGIENAQDFEDWCSEYGYDTDSRKAEKTYKQCEHETRRLKNFLGDDLYQQLLWNTERQ